MESVINIISDALGVSPTEVTLNSILEEMGLDSLLERYEIAYMMEDGFNIRPFPDEEVEQWITIADICKSVERRIDVLQE